MCALAHNVFLESTDTFVQLPQPPVTLAFAFAPALAPRIAIGPILVLVPAPVLAPAPARPLGRTQADSDRFQPR